jgi:hypothetical protein
MGTFRLVLNGLLVILLCNGAYGYVKSYEFDWVTVAIPIVAIAVFIDFIRRLKAWHASRKQ